MAVNPIEHAIAYVNELSIYRPEDDSGWRALRSGAEIVAHPPVKSAVDAGAVVAFTDKVPAAQRQDILDAVQLAQRAADGLCDRHAETESWYRKFTEVLSRVGWTSSEFAFVKHNQAEGELKIDARALKILAAVATQNALGVLTESLSVLEGMADKDHAINIFKRFASTDLSGNFQLGAAALSEQGALSMALGAFYFHAEDRRTKTLFGSYGANDISFWSAAQSMTLNQRVYDNVRSAVQKQLGDPSDYVVELKLA
jgi:hypothetical protein